MSHPSPLPSDQLVDCVPAEAATRYAPTTWRSAAVTTAPLSAVNPAAGDPALTLCVAAVANTSSPASATSRDAVVAGLPMPFEAAAPARPVTPCHSLACTATPACEEGHSIAMVGRPDDAAKPTHTDPHSCWQELDARLHATLSAGDRARRVFRRIDGQDECASVHRGGVQRHDQRRCVRCRISLLLDERRAGARADRRTAHVRGSTAAACLRSSACPAIECRAASVGKAAAVRAASEAGCGCAGIAMPVAQRIGGVCRCLVGAAGAGRHAGPR